MPTIFRAEGFRFFFFSNEGSPREPIHVHARRDGHRAKFWLHPVSLARNQGFSGHELNELAKLVEAQKFEIERAWHEYFGD
jgi:hypothetical protein